jgi:hypothetical protein
MTLVNINVDIHRPVWSVTMVNRQQFIAEYLKACKVLGLPPRQVVVSAGGACLMYGLREETDDLDVDVPEAFWDKLVKAGHEPLKFHKPFPGELIQYDEKLALHHWEGVATRMVDGVCVYAPIALLEQKLKLNRPKDQADIAALKEMIKAG